MIEVATRVAGRYRIDARLGGGGMADVFEARDESLDRDVAIKLLRGIDDETAARRFADEIRLTARLNHPNVVRLFDAGEHDGSPYLVLERVTGGTLAAQMAQGPMEPRRVADIGRQVAAALGHAHSEGIVHRDVKPSNVLLTPDGTVRLADFGIALTATATRLTVAGSVAGSAGYVSPEQVLGTGAGPASDVYSLGLLLLECLAGEPPWSGTTVEVALARITADPPIPATLPEAWQGLLAAMTARNPDQRPSMGAVAAALEDLAAGREVVVFPVPVPQPPPSRLRVPALLAAVVLLAAAVVAGVTRLDGLNLPDDAEVPVAASDADVAAEDEPAPMDAVIVASAVRGAAVGELRPSPLGQTEASSAARDRSRRERGDTARQPVEQMSDAATRADQPAGGSTATAPRNRTTTTRPSGATTTTTSPTRPRTTTTTGSRPTGGGTTTTDGGDTSEPTSGTDSGASTGGDTSGDDVSGAGDVVDTKPRGNTKTKTQREDVGVPAGGSSKVEVIFPDGRSGK